MAKPRIQNNDDLSPELLIERLVGQPATQAIEAIQEDVPIVDNGNKPIVETTGDHLDLVASRAEARDTRGPRSQSQTIIRL